MGNLMSGQYLKIKIDIENYSNYTYRNCFIGIGIFSLNEVMLTALKSDVLNVYYDIKAGRNTIYCIIKKLPLSPGVYKYNINVRDFADIFDSIQDAEYLEVESGNFFDTGKVPASSRQTILIDQNWS
jgi:hypothetical protein